MIDLKTVTLPAHICAALCISALSCACQREPRANPPDMPALKPRASVPDAATASAEEGKSIVLAPSHVVSGARAYYRVYGKWPARWSDVVAEGLGSAQVVTPDGKLVDPDDGRLDFQYDCMYERGISASNPVVTTSLDPTTQRAHSADVAQPQTYAAMLSYFKPGSHGFDYVERYASDTARLKQWAIIGQVRIGLIQYREVLGEYPPDLQTYLDWGQGVIDASSINPLTNDVYHGDGRANDIYYRFEANPDVMPLVMPVDADGEKCRAELSY